ncbi:unnamed protein product [Tilletia caries]|uniref:Uncharacterized protein n=2 Tax=Tilletia TaxID=13289 RepID=A0A8T8T5L7_9BASI|nr:hypothetical protein A4X03_0g5186 [Tilletia caries]CAD7065449.1 unnamed protein product [Tilletia caries]
MLGAEAAKGALGHGLLRDVTRRHYTHDTANVIWTALAMEESLPTNIKDNLERSNRFYLQWGGYATRAMAQALRRSSSDDDKSGVAVQDLAIPTDLTKSELDNIESSTEMERLKTLIESSLDRIKKATGSYEPNALLVVQLVTHVLYSLLLSRRRLLTGLITRSRLYDFTTYSPQMTSTTTPNPKNPAAENVLGDIGLTSTSSIGALGFNIYGSADSAAKLVAMARARRSEKDSELKVNKTVPVLTGTKDFVTWRMMLLGLFVPYLGGRYWHLLQKDPSTSVDAYRNIFAPSDDKPIDREEAAAHRSADLIAVHGLLLQTLHVDVLQSFNEETSSGNFDGGRLWDALSAKYAGKDLGSKRAAENAIRTSSLEP